MIYIGYYKPELLPATEKFPELLKMCEKELLDWGKANWQKLDNTWVNNYYLICHIPQEHDLMVTLSNGVQKLLKTHPKYKLWTKPEYFNAAEFYSFISIDKWE